jgi:hypothetical protein
MQKSGVKFYSSASADELTPAHAAWFRELYNLHVKPAFVVYKKNGVKERWVVQNSVQPARLEVQI